MPLAIAEDRHRVGPAAATSTTRRRGRGRSDPSRPRWHRRRISDVPPTPPSSGFPLDSLPETTPKLGASGTPKGKPLRAVGPPGGVPATHGPRVVLVTWPGTVKALSCPANPGRHVGGLLIPAGSAPVLADSHRVARGRQGRPRQAAEGKGRGEPAALWRTNTRRATSKGQVALRPIRRSGS